jgi:MFS family permease
VLGSLTAVFRNRDIRRLELAWAASNVGGWGYLVGVSIFAYDEGGVGAVGLVHFVRLLAGASAAPFLAVLADRKSRKLVMLGAHCIGGSALLLAALATTAGTALLVYALVVCFEIAHSPFRPAQAALVPSLARGPEELTAANAVASTIESGGVFAGPALGGLLLAFTSPGATLAAAGTLFLSSSVLITRIDEPPRAEEPAEEEETVSDRLLAGFRTILQTSRVRLLVGLFAALTLAYGILFVLIVPLAVDVLDRGDAGVGFLNSALGVGGVIGSLVVLALLERGGLGSLMAIGLLLWGLPLLVLAGWPTLASALLLLALVGTANSLVEVSGLTLLQRTVPDEVLGRVFGVLETVGLGSVGVGSLVGSLLVTGLGTRWALAGAGSFLAVVGVTTWSRLRALEVEAPRRELELLRGIPIFAPLASSTLDTLATKLVPVGAPEGTEVVRQGEAGDRFFVVGEGRLDVDVDGARGAPLGPGDFFGEIALLRNVPRTATVTAVQDSSLYALERGDFIAAVTGHAESKAATDSVVATRLRALRPTAG